jgi:hypothetical protein
VAINKKVQVCADLLLDVDGLSRRETLKLVRCKSHCFGVLRDLRKENKNLVLAACSLSLCS